MWLKPQRKQNELNSDVRETNQRDVLSSMNEPKNIPNKDYFNKYPDMSVRIRPGDMRTVYR
jgi:hypothetical protein